jgi:Ca2+-binding RTX toxin-like protein
MSSLNAQQLAILEGHVTAGDRIAYYTQLAAWGDRYAALCLGVVNNDTWAGSTANIFFLQEAAENGGPQPFGWDNFASMSLDLMRADWTARQQYGLDLPVDVIWGYHTAVFEDYEAPSDAWTPSFLLSNLATVGEREAIWDSFLAIGEASVSTAWFSVLWQSGWSSVAGFNDYVLDVAAASLLATTAPSTDYGPFSVALPGGGNVVGGNYGADVLLGTANNDALIGFDGADALSGAEGNDRLHGGVGDDILVGGHGGDRLYGGAGVDHVAADIVFAPNDEFPEPSWAFLTDYVPDYLYGGEGVDIYYTGLSVTMAALDLSLDGFEVFDRFAIYSGIYPNYIFNQNVWENMDVISDSDGQGAILYAMVSLEDGSSETGSFGGEINYTAVWQDGIMPFYRLMKSDDLEGTSFGRFVIQPYLDPETGITSDRLVFFSSEISVAMFAIENFVNGDFGITIPGYVGSREGGDGDDYIAPPRPVPVPENLDGKAGEDTVDYSANTAAVEINLETGQGAYGGAIANIENVIATAYDDSLAGNAADNELHGLAGEDTFAASDGSDLLDGGDDIDEVVFSGDAADFQISLTALGQVEVQNATGISLLSNIEFVQFDDQRIDTSDLGAPAGGWTAADDRFWADANTPIVVDVTANDTMPSGANVNAYIWTQPQNGTIAWNGTGYTYTPDTGFTGVDWFGYGLHDGDNGDASMDGAVAVVHVGGTQDPNDMTGITVDVGGSAGTYASGSDFNDTVNFLGGNSNYVETGDGNDRIVFEGDADDYEIIGQGEHFVITNISTGEGVQFRQVEYIQFDDDVDVPLSTIIANAGRQPGDFWFQPEPIGGLV